MALSTDFRQPMTAESNSHIKDTHLKIYPTGEQEPREQETEVQEEQDEEKHISVEIAPIHTFRGTFKNSYPSLTETQIQQSGNLTPSRTLSTLRGMDRFDIDSMTFSEFKSKQKSFRLSFLRMFNELMSSTERRCFYFGCFLTLGCGALRLLFFIFMGSIIDLLAGTYNTNLHKICDIHKYISCEEHESMIHVFVITLIIVSMATQLIRYALSTLTTYYIISLMKRLNSIIFERIIKQNLSYFDFRTKRDLRYLLTSDMKHISISLHNNVIIIESGVHFLCGIIYIFVINWDIGVIIIASFIVLLMISLFYIKKYNIIYELYKKSFTHVIASVVEMLNYITTIKTFAKEDDESFIYNVCIDRAFHNLNNKTSLTNGYRFWMGIMISFTILAIVWYGSFIIMNDDANDNNNNNNNTLTLGFLIVDLFILLHINFCIYQIVHLLPAIILKCSKSLNRILDVYDLSSSIEVENNKTQNYIPVECKICGEIEIKNISFSYPKRKNKLILNNISLNFLPSQITALIGESGCGKSTIMKLIMRFFEPNKDCDSTGGWIKIDNYNIKDYNLPFLLSQIGYVSQDVNLFENRSIGDNIKFGMKLDRKHHYLFDVEYFDEESMYFWRMFKSITQTDVEKAAGLANAHQFIMDLEKGYDTIIGGENGIKLSHGQKQRIGIARALLLDPKILLLDEAMTGIDSISKSLINQALDKCMIGRCVIVCAHRLKTVQNAQQVYVIKNGKIVDQGTHDQLMKKANIDYVQLTNRHLFS